MLIAPPHQESQSFAVPWEERMVGPGGCHVATISSELCDSWRCLGLAWLLRGRNMWPFKPLAASLSLE